MGFLRTLWRNRHWLKPIAEQAEALAEAGFVAADIRARLADGIQREDIVSEDALETVVKARRKAATGWKVRHK